MPYANRKGEGFENKLAALVGKALNWSVEPIYWPDPRYYVRDYLEKALCDVTLGVTALLPFRLCLYQPGPR
jgi:mxaJ protein